MDFNLTIEQQQIRDEIKKVCKEFPDAYWRKVDSEKAYPDVFVKKLGGKVVFSKISRSGIFIVAVSVAQSPRRIISGLLC